MPLAYYRISANEKILVVINPTKNLPKIKMENAPKEIIYSFGNGVQMEENCCVVDGESAVFVIV